MDIYNLYSLYNPITSFKACKALEEESFPLNKAQLGEGIKRKDQDSQESDNEK